MHLSKAIQLVRKKFLEERNGRTTGRTSDQYNDACKQYPATMKTAHILWARELAKGM